VVPGHKHTDQLLSDLSSVKEHLENLMPKDLLQILADKSRSNPESTFAIKAALRTKNVAAGIGAQEISRRLYGNHTHVQGFFSR